MAGYTKLWSTIVTSSIWSEDDKTRIMWITMLATAEATGYVPGSIPGMAALARMSVEDADRAIQRLLQPDPYSRTADCNGARLTLADGGWKIVNYMKYRAGRDEVERREQNRAAQRRLRNRAKNEVVSANVSQRKPSSAQAEAEALVLSSYEEERTKEEHCANVDRPDRWAEQKTQFDEARKLYPGTKRGLETEFANFRKKHKDWRDVLPDLRPAILLIQHERKRKATAGEFVPEWPHFRTWINQRRWEQAENVEV